MDIIDAPNMLMDRSFLYYLDELKIMGIYSHIEASEYEQATWIYDKTSFECF